MDSWDRVMNNDKQWKSWVVYPCGSIVIKMEELSRAADADVHRSSTASFSSELVVIFQGGNVKIVLALLTEVAAERGRNLPDTELPITFVECGYLIVRYILKLRGADLQKGPIREPV